MHVLFPPPLPPSAFMAMHGIHCGGMKEGEKNPQQIILFLSIPSDGSPLGSLASVLLARGPGLLWYPGSFCRD